MSGDIFGFVPSPSPRCPNCHHAQAMHDAVLLNPASPTCSCVHPFHKDDARQRLVAAWRAGDSAGIAAVLRSRVLTQREEAECVIEAQGGTPLREDTER